LRDRTLLRALECLPDPFAVLIATRNDSGTIVDLPIAFANGAALRLMERIENAAELAEHCRKVLDTGVSARLEGWCREPGGRQCFEIVVSPMDDGICWMGHDVTAAKAAMAEARDTARNLRQALEIGQTVSFRVDRQFRYLWCISDRIGATNEDFRGKTDFDLFEPDSAAMLQDIYRGVFQSRTGARRDIKVRSRFHSDLQFFDLVVEPHFDEAGDVDGLTGAAYEVTDRINAQQAAERANQDKSRFLAAASHDLRQPLQGLALYFNVLAGRLPPGNAQVVKGMEYCMASLTNLLNDILDISKLDAGAVTCDIRDFAVADLLEMTVSAHAPAARKKGVRLRRVATAANGRTDPVLFGRMIGNLIANAVSYTDKGGIVVGCRRRQGKRWVEIWDSGIGIPADKQGDIFKEFQQLGDRERGTCEGSGLGLAIVLRTAELLGLEVRVASRPGRGSVFAIELPPGETPPAAAPEIGPRPLRIALLEDDVNVLQALALALKSSGHQVVPASTLSALLAGLSGAAPDVLVADYRLGADVTAMDAIASVRTAFGDRVPAIVLTGDTDAHLDGLMAEKCLPIVHKPLSLDALLACLARVTE